MAIDSNYIPNLGDAQLLYNDLRNRIKTKADADSVFGEKAAAIARKIISDQYAEDKIPYLFRKSYDADFNEDKLIGGTVAWNQVSGPIDSSNKWGAYGGTFSKADGVASFTEVALYATAQNNINMVVNHKYLISCDAKVTNSSDYFHFFAGNNSTYSNKGVMVNISNVSDTNWHKYEKIGVFTDADSENNIVAFKCNHSTSNIQFKNVNVFDLTAMFGATIADYLYTLETSTAGAGVAWFRNLFPNPYYAYDAGSLQSVQAKSHITRGFNQWDEVWELGKIGETTGNLETSTTHIRSKNKIPALPNTSYYFYIPNNSQKVVSIHAYDINDNWLGRYRGDVANNLWIKTGGGYYMTYPVFVTPKNTRYLRFSCPSAYVTTYNDDICINLHWDGERDGEYEPYNGHVYPMGSDELRGMFKLDANNNLYADGDVKTADGTVKRIVNTLNLKDLSDWSSDAENSSGYIRFIKSISDKANGFDIVCDKIEVNLSAVVAANASSQQISGSSSNKSIYLAIKASNLSGDLTTEAGRSTALVSWLTTNQVNIIYKLGTPTTESADPFEIAQDVFHDGTEEYVDAAVTATTPTRDVAIPVGHESKYYKDFRREANEKIEATQKLMELIITSNRENAMKATRAYSSGNLLIVNGTLYKASTSIANGATLTVGTNITATTVADELAALA